MRHFDVQLIGGMVLHRGTIAEMKTGEGKTLVATLPVYLNALTGKGVHVVTVNDYLAKRDSDWMGRIFRFLGLTVGVIQHDLDDRERQEAYARRHHLRDEQRVRLRLPPRQHEVRHQSYVQRGHNFAIVDEVDSILIDEARTPLIISGPAEESTDKYYRIDSIIPKLSRGRITGDKKAEERGAREDRRLHRRREGQDGHPHRRRGWPTSRSSSGVTNLYDPVATWTSSTTSTRGCARTPSSSATSTTW